tara:strand:+ start:9446 stop:9901 length:456 start_codon:yes stop_codon:yes gene_type:complete
MSNLVGRSLLTVGLSIQVMYIIALLDIHILDNSIASQEHPEPTPKLVLPATVTEVYDGDTVTCEITMRLRVRLLDCWAPELSDSGGAESRDHLKELAEGKPGKVVVSLAGVDRLDDVLTFGRLLAHVWVDGRDVSDAQVQTGHATRERPPR